MDLDSPATQSGFAKLVGVSQQAIQTRVADGQLDQGGTYRDWLQSYCAQLRAEAAGRGGDEHAALTKARTRQAIADAQAKELAYHRELGHLVPLEEIEPALADWAAMARAEVINATEKLIAAVQSQHGIEIDQQSIDDTIHPALRAIGSYPSRMAAGADEDGASVDTDAA